ncbi:Glycosyl transferase family 2, partial [Pseudobutyrivibrio sp. ACV-2]
MKVSFVIPCYRSEKTLEIVVSEIQNKMQQMTEHTYEIILVNDCSPDGTLSVIRRLCADNENIIGIDHAKNFGQHAALMAGFSFVSGDVVVCLDDDGQTPADEVDKL